MVRPKLDLISLLRRASRRSHDSRIQYQDIEFLLLAHKFPRCVFDGWEGREVALDEGDRWRVRYGRLNILYCIESFGFGACREVDVCRTVLRELEDGFFAEADVACVALVRAGRWRGREDVPPVMNITFPTREGMSVEGLKETPPAKRGNPNGIYFGV